MTAYGKWTDNLPAFDAEGSPQPDVVVFTYGYVLVVNIVLIQVVVAGACSNTPTRTSAVAADASMAKNARLAGRLSLQVIYTNFFTPLTPMYSATTLA